DEASLLAPILHVVKQFRVRFDLGARLHGDLPNEAFPLVEHPQQALIGLCGPFTSPAGWWSERTQ
ncbi:MAG: hypothetical protein ACE5JA_11140, partial [bacterium]